jgi:hypothetical protein
MYELESLGVLLGVIMGIFRSTYLIEVLLNTILLVSLCNSVYLISLYCGLVYMLIFFSGLYLLYLLSVMYSSSSLLGVSYVNILRISVLSSIVCLNNLCYTLYSSIDVLESISNISLLLYNSEIIINLGLIIIIGMVCLKLVVSPVPGFRLS